MKTKRLGDSSRHVASIGQGTMGVGGYFERSSSGDERAVKLLRMGINLGMTLIDTAESYADGHAEELVGRAIEGVRDRVFVATKFSPENSRFDGVLKAAEGSLKRLGTHYIDLYQTHWPTPRVPFDETMRALAKLVEDGRVRYVGLSNCSVRDMKLAEPHLPRGILVSTQQEYNLAERTVEEQLLPFCRAERYTLIAYSPLARGRIAREEWRLATLSELARNYDVSVAQLVLNWLIYDETVMVIPKASTDEHVRENAASADFTISRADHDRISELFRMEVIQIPTDSIQVTDDVGRSVYKTVAEAIENRLNLVPSPLELSKEILAGEMLKPVKVRVIRESHGKTKYQLTDGRTRYWAWVIAYEGGKPIPAIVE